ncbi:MAG: hypothetical protein ACOX5R_05770 [bacterium]|jgi:hypothetical protein
MENVRKGIRDRLSELPEYGIVIVLMPLHVLFILTVLVPRLGNLNLFDESFYITVGYLFHEGELPRFAHSPLVCLIYAITYAFVKEYSQWMLYCATAVRMMNFMLLWLALYLVSRQFRDRIPLPLPLFLFLCYPIADTLLTNPSYALFAALSMLALSLVLQDMKHPDSPASMIMASLVLAGAALTRLDGIVLFFVLIPLCFFVSRGRWIGTLLELLLPFCSVLGGYFLLYYGYTGSWEHGVSARSYHAFEQGEGVAYQHRYQGQDPLVEGELRARQLYGTAEENRNSIINAVLRNPGACMKRIFYSIIHLPRQILRAYGKYWAIPLLFLAAVGSIQYLADRDRRLPVLCAWSLHLLIYGITFFREEYFLLIYAIPLLLAATGLWQWSRYGIRKWLLISENQKSIFFLLVIIAALIFRIHHMWDDLKMQKNIPSYEEVVLYLSEAHEMRQPVATYAMGPIWAAKMVPVLLSGKRDIQNLEQLTSWLRGQKVELVLVDELLQNREPEIYQIIQSGLGAGFQLQFQSSEERIMVFRLISD